MHLLASVVLLLGATPGTDGLDLRAAAGEGSVVVSSEREPADPKPGGLDFGLYALGASAVALGAAAGVLLSLPLTVPILYLAALASLPTAVGALPLLLAVPVAAGLGSGGAASAFSEGIGPWLVATLSGAAAGLTVLVVGVLVASGEPRTPLDLHLGVLSLVGMPSLAAAATAAVVLPFFLTGTGPAFE